MPPHNISLIKHTIVSTRYWKWIPATAAVDDVQISDIDTNALPGLGLLYLDNVKILHLIFVTY